MLERVVDYIIAATPKKLIILGTIIVLFASIPTVCILSCLAGVEYTFFILILSIVLPLLLTPITLFIFIRLTTRLAYFQSHLNAEIEKNKAKDLILFEQTRFALMGEMLANISHQWKQPLNTISLATLNLQMLCSEQSQHKRYFEIIESNINHLAATIDDFSSFFDKRDAKSNKSLTQIVREIESIVEANIKSSAITLEMQISKSAHGVKIASSISQVLINLINNAKDALEGCEQKKILLEFFADTKGVEIFCSDTGSGIDAEIKERIFDPYFSTKDRSEGTGIGLYMSKQIINKIFDGTLELVNEPKEGYTTSFRLSLSYTKSCQNKESNL